jgi:beta-galactosidase
MPNTAAYQHVLHLFPHWNWNPATNASVQVWAYSNANEIELFLNDASQV